jgi:uncharacterized protein
MIRFRQELHRLWKIEGVMSSPIDAGREALANLLILRGEEICPAESVTVCRDPKDNKFLEVAATGRADVIVTGDDDLLVLHPFRGIPILGPREFLTMLSAG